MSNKKEKKVLFTSEEKDLLVKLGEKIKKKRNDLNLSQSDLAEKTGIDRSYISMVERGETNITYLKLKRIEKVLDLKF